MKIVLPIIGTAAVVFQLIRFWPVTLATLLSAFVTGGVFYIACKLGWDTQKGRILQDGYKGWGDWFKRTLFGIVAFLALSLGLLFFSYHNPICKETGDPFYGRCEKFVEESAETKSGNSFNLGGKAFYPLCLAIAFITGSVATRIEYLRRKGQGDRRISSRKY